MGLASEPTCIRSVWIVSVCREPLFSEALEHYGPHVTNQLIVATIMQVALAWLLHRAANILLIPGTSSTSHLHENLAAVELALTGTALAELGAIERQNGHQVP